MPPQTEQQAWPTGAAEELVDQLWSQLLGISPIEPDDHFADLGGTSLLAEQLLLSLQQQWPAAVDAATLADLPSARVLAERLAEALRAESTSRTTTTVTLRAGSSGRHVFCVAGAGASAVGFLPLASALDRSVGVHVFEPAGLYTRRVPDWTVKRAARRHLSDLLRIATDQPYVIVGHSFGGHIAARLGAELSDAGQPPAGILLLDTIAHRDPGTSVAELVVASPPEDSGRWNRLRTHARVYSVGMLRFEPERHRAALWEQAIRVQNRHRVPRLGERSVVFVSEQNIAQADHWRARALHPEDQVVCVPGDHHGVLHDPETVTQVAEHIAKQFQLGVEESPA